MISILKDFFKSPAVSDFFRVSFYIILGTVLVFDILLFFETIHAIKSEVLGKGDFLQAIVTIITGTFVVFWLKEDDRKYDSEKNRIHKDIDLLEAKFVALMNLIEDNDPDINTNTISMVYFLAKVNRETTKVFSLIEYVKKNFTNDIELKVQNLSPSLDGSFNSFCNALDETKEIDGVEYHYLSSGSDASREIRQNIYVKHLEFISVLSEIRKLSS